MNEDRAKSKRAENRDKAKVTQSESERKATASDLPFPFNTRDLPDAIDEAAFGSGDFPYDKKMKRKRYEKALAKLQIELMKFQTWVRETGERVVIVFEGRDGAGKGGNIARFTQHLNPRTARIVALSKPTDAEKGQWYFQRYASHMPTKGEIVFFDRSWYNRAGVERVMGFADHQAVRRFLADVPQFERLLTDAGIRLVKFFITIGKEMQIKRLHARFFDPLKQWKLSPIDYQAPAKWAQYTEAFEEMLAATDSEHAPWTIVRANDKMRARLATIRQVLHAFAYTGKDADAVGEQDDKIVLSARDYLRQGGED
jgi:polyphosphate kinase 2